MLPREGHQGPPLPAQSAEGSCAARLNWPAGADAGIAASAIAHSEISLACRLATSPFGTMQTAKISGLRQPPFNRAYWGLCESH